MRGGCESTTERAISILSIWRFDDDDERTAERDFEDYLWYSEFFLHNIKKSFFFEIVKDERILISDF